MEVWEGSVDVDGGRLHYRVVGSGEPIVVLHGGPDFDHTYLLPELDRLAEPFRVICYDQRGRGRSAPGVAPEDVTLESEVADLEQVLRFFDLDAVTVLGHSWGGLLALEHAARHPDRVSHLVLMNTAPVSHGDRIALSAWLDAHRPAADVREMRSVAETAAYEQGDLEAERVFYRAHFRMTVGDEKLDRLVARLRVHFSPETVLLARAIERRLYDETWNLDTYDAVIALSEARIPTLLLHGQSDFIPRSIAERIARDLDGSHLVVLPECGHFALLDRPDEVHEEITAFLAAT